MEQFYILKKPAFFTSRRFDNIFIACETTSKTFCTFKMSSATTACHTHLRHKNNTSSFLSGLPSFDWGYDFDRTFARPLLFSFLGRLSLNIHVRPSTKCFSHSDKFGMWVEVDEWCTKVCHMTRSRSRSRTTSRRSQLKIQSISSANETWVVSSFGLQLLEKKDFAWPHSDRNSALFITKALRSKNKASIDYLFGTFKHTLSFQWTPPWSPI